METDKNEGLEEIPENTTEELEYSLSEMKKRTPGEDETSKEMIQLGGTMTLEAVRLL